MSTDCTCFRLDQLNFSGRTTTLRETRCLPRTQMKNLFSTVLVGALIALPVHAETRVPTSLAEIATGFVPVVKAATPSVVNIYAKRIVETQANPLASDPFFSEFFRNFANPGPQVQNSLGSGVILSADGLVVSNFHVVGGASEIRVVLNDRREYDAEILLSDQVADLAVLRLKGARDLPAIALRSSSEVEVGELVLAIGNPFGVGQTVSSGIISGLARSGGAIGNARAYFIQTDAPINPGNSGGALVDMAGALVGINTSILTRSGGSNGIGFAIPSDLVAAFLKQARAGNSQFHRPWAGMVGQMVDAALADSLGLDRPEGMIIADMHVESPFARAGLAPGDVILSIDGNPVNGPAEMLYHMSVIGAGATATLDYASDGTRRQARVAMIEAPEIPARNQTRIDSRGPLDGLTLANINPAVITELNLPLTAAGVVVERAEGMAARMGFQPGDLLLEVNGRKIETLDEAVAAAAERTGSWDVTIERGGQPMSMRVRL
jgi:Do/DeqQ family serine protease